MLKFTIVRRGYCLKEVDEYIEKYKQIFSDKLKEMNMRINELKNQNIKLIGKINILKRREDDVKNALIIANGKANDIIETAKMKYALEGQRLKLFQSKWLNYFENQTSGDDEYKREMTYYENVEIELKNVLKKEFGILFENKKNSVNDEIIEQYRSEANRLFATENYEDLYEKIIEENKIDFSESISDGINTDEKEKKSKKSKKNKNNNFIFSGSEKEDFEDLSNLAAIKPDKSLEELCKDLGL